MCEKIEKIILKIFIVFTYKIVIKRWFLFFSICPIWINWESSSSTGFLEKQDLLRDFERHWCGLKSWRGQCIKKCSRVDADAKKECADFLSIVKGGDRRIGKVDAQGGLFGEQYELLVNILKP